MALALMGHVVIVGRDRQRTYEATRAIREAAGGKVDAFVADLSSQAQVRRLAGELLSALPRIDVLINNAGGYWNTRNTTADGIEHTFALNHLAPFLLTNLLLERLQLDGPGQVITVSSNAQAMRRINFNDPQGKHNYSAATAYNQSKLANLLFTYELARRHLGNSQCPASGIGKHRVRSGGPRVCPAAARPAAAALHADSRPRR